MADSIYPIVTRLLREEAIAEGFPASVFFTEFVGDLTAASAVIAGIADTSTIEVGDKIYHTIVNGEAARTVLSKTSTTITLSAVAGTTQADQPMVAVRPAAGFEGLDGKDIRLYLSSLEPTEETTLAELEAAEALYTGWTPPAGVWDSGALSPAGQAIGESQLVVATPSGAVDPAVSIGGAWVDDGVNPIQIWPLDTPVTLTGTTTPLKFMLTDMYPTPGELIQVLP